MPAAPWVSSWEGHHVPSDPVSTSAFSSVTSYPWLCVTSRNLCRHLLQRKHYFFCVQSIPALLPCCAKALRLQSLAADVRLRAVCQGHARDASQPAQKAADSKTSPEAPSALTCSALIEDNKQPHSSSPNSEILCYTNNASSYLDTVHLKYSLTWAVKRPYGHFNLVSEDETHWKCRVLKAV